MNNKTQKLVEVFTDGACSGNPGPGGWGAILRYKGKEKEISGGASDTTNNKMELSAIIEALKTLKEPCCVDITTDSKYVANAFTEKWLEKWQSNNWKTSDKKPVKNQELWQELLELSKIHQLSWHWIKGHAGHSENERCDKLAVIQRDLFAKKNV